MNNLMEIITQQYFASFLNFMVVDVSKYKYEILVLRQSCAHYLKLNWGETSFIDRLVAMVFMSAAQTTDRGNVRPILTGRSLAKIASKIKSWKFFTS